MEPFIRLTATAAHLPANNIDTDAIIPSRETQSVARSGYGEKLFANWRYVPGTREPVTDFVLNRAPFTQAQILVSGRNFGCGSSREAAVWALAQFGIRCVIAESFGAIFRNNCIRNGLLPVTLGADELEQLQQSLADKFVLTVDLETMTVTSPNEQSFAFQIGPRDRQMLMSGADEITLTLNRREQIEKFREQDRHVRPWLYDSKADGAGKKDKRS